MPSSRGSSQPRDQTHVSSWQADSLLSEPPGKPKNTGVGRLSLLQGIFLTKLETGSPALQADSLPAEPPGKPHFILNRTMHFNVKHLYLIKQESLSYVLFALLPPYSLSTFERVFFFFFFLLLSLSHFLTFIQIPSHAFQRALFWLNLHGHIW